MKDDYNGIEEYSAYEKDYCDEIIKHFEVMARNAAPYKQDNLNANPRRTYCF